MTEQETSRVLMAMLGAHPDLAGRLTAEQSRAMVKTWTVVLADLDYQVCDRALLRLLATREKPPSVAAVRAAALELIRGVPKGGGEAWGGVVKLLARFGVHRHPTLADVGDAAAWQALQAIGGWAAFCNSENSAADRARFVEAYDKIAARETTEARTGALPGAQAGSAAQLVGKLAHKLAGGTE